MVVFADDPAEDGCSPDAVCGQVGDRLVGRLGLRRTLASTLVGTMPVVVGLVFVQHASQVGLVDDQDPVEDLAAERPDEALAGRVLTAGIAAMITGNGVLIATMVIATVLLWLMATARKATCGRRAPADHIDHAPRPAESAHR